MNLGTHADFIIAAYLVTALIVVSLIVWVMLDYAAQRRVLGEFDRRGIMRRSHRASDKTQ